MVLRDLLPQRGQLFQPPSTGTSGLGVLNALTQQVKQASLQTKGSQGSQWTEFHQLLKGALQQARQDIRETRRDDRHESLASRIQGRVEYRQEALQVRQTEARPSESTTDTNDTPLDASSATSYALRAEWLKINPNKPERVKGNEDDESLTELPELDNNTLDTLIDDLRKLGLTLPGEPSTSSTSESSKTSEASPDTPVDFDATIILDVLPNSTEQLKTLLPQLPANEQPLLTQVIKGLDKFSAVVNLPPAPPIASAPIHENNPVAPPVSGNLQESLKTMVESLPDEAKEALKQVFQLLNDAKQARQPQADALTQVAETTADEAKPVFSNNAFVHPFQALLRHLGHDRDTQPVTPQPQTALSGTLATPQTPLNVALEPPASEQQTAQQALTPYGSAPQASQNTAQNMLSVILNQSSPPPQSTKGETNPVINSEKPTQPDAAPPILSDASSFNTDGDESDNSTMGNPFTPSTPAVTPVVDQTTIALNATVSLTSRAGMTNPIAQNRSQAFNHPIQSQVVEAAQIAIKDGKNELMVQLNPQHLGKVTVTLTSDANKQVTAVLVTESTQVRNELEKDIKGFIRSMEHHGVNLVKVSVIQANTEAKTSHNAAQDQDAAPQQQSANQQNSSGSHSQREAFEWHQQLIQNTTFAHDESDGAQNDVGTVSAQSSIENETPAASSDSDGGIDIRA